MANKFSFAKIKQKHDEQFHLTRDFKLKIAKMNYKSIMVLMHLSFVVGVISTIFLLIKYHSDLYSKLSTFIYFGAFWITSLIGILMGMFVKHVIGKKNGLWFDLPFYYALVCVMLCVLYRSFRLGNIVTGVLLIAIISLVILIFCNPNPQVFTTFMFFPFLAEAHLMIIYGVSWTVYADFILLYVVLGILAHYKRAYLIRSLKATAELEEKKHILEMEFAKQSSEIEDQAIELLHQNRKLMKMQNETIISLSNLVENRDSDTGAHVKRTSKYVNLLSTEALKKKIYPDIITWDFVELATKSAPLHDIGKIAVPDAVLKKPGRLTDDEFEKIKIHTLKGGKIVNDVLGVADDENYIKMASDIAMYHHEKWDGNGYPKGLKKDEIPVSARIMAIADVFDALVSKRCYKEAMTYEEAFECIEVSSGSHFDPVFVAIFLENKDKIIEIAEKYADK